MIGPALPAHGRLECASASRHRSWAAQSLVIFGLIAILLAPTILVIEIREWALRGEWPGCRWRTGSGCSASNEERSESALHG